MRSMSRAKSADGDKGSTVNAGLRGEAYDVAQSQSPLTWGSTVERKFLSPPLGAYCPDDLTLDALDHRSLELRVIRRGEPLTTINIAHICTLSNARAGSRKHTSRQREGAQLH